MEVAGILDLIKFEIVAKNEMPSNAHWYRNDHTFITQHNLSTFNLIA